MARSVIWPRKTTYKDYFCAELIASALQIGGLMDRQTNPGSATPESLYRAFSQCGATTGNPCTMRHFSSRGAPPYPSVHTVSDRTQTSAVRTTENGTKEERRPLLQGLRSWFGWRRQSSPPNTSRGRGPANVRTVGSVSSAKQPRPIHQAPRDSMDAIELGIGTTDHRTSSTIHRKTIPGSIAEQRIREAVRRAVAGESDGGSSVVGMYTPVLTQSSVR